MPKVLNLRHYSKSQITAMIASGNAVRCDRQSRHGNPFRMQNESQRDFVCDQFEAKVLPNLDVSSLAGKDLLCWCAPKRCHCDAILRKANS